MDGKEGKNEVVSIDWARGGNAVVKWWELDFGMSVSHSVDISRVHYFNLAVLAPICRRCSFCFTKSQFLTFLANRGV